jgi:hypothetical protein
MRFKHLFVATAAILAFVIVAQQLTPPFETTTILPIAGKAHAACDKPR